MLHRFGFLPCNSIEKLIQVTDASSFRKQGGQHFVPLQSRIVSVIIPDCLAQLSALRFVRPSQFSSNTVVYYSSSSDEMASSAISLYAQKGQASGWTSRFVD